MDLSIQVNYEATSNLLEADTWLRNLEKYSIISCDFEVAVRYTDTDLAHFQSIVDSPTSTNLERRNAQSKLRATALDHPSHCTVTHLSAAWSETDAYVFVITSPKLLNRIMNWLVTTTVTQVWHNASFDMKYVYHHTGKFPIHLEDSQVLAKCILNHVETDKARTGLKELEKTDVCYRAFRKASRFLPAAFSNVQMPPKRTRGWKPEAEDDEG